MSDRIPQPPNTRFAVAYRRIGRNALREFGKSMPASQRPGEAISSSNLSKDAKSDT